MKKTLGFLLICILSFSCVNAASLDSFVDSEKYTSGIFSDVPSESWFESGVITVYEKGIMTGTGENMFSPSQSVTWAQAVTIASRLSAVYTGSDIPKASGKWYECYVEYSKSSGIMPDGCPDVAEMETLEITRQEIAGLFNNVISKEELSVINDSDIPDINEVSEEYKDAVINMYAAGIITGKDNGDFDPLGKATRAEIATIITRLIKPAQRVGYDKRVSKFMSEQSGNFYNGGMTATIGDVSYYTIYTTSDDGTKTYKIKSRNLSGEIAEVYTSSEPINWLSVLDTGELLFVENSTVLYKYDLKTRKKSKLFASDYISTYGLYDGKIYICELYTDEPAQYQIIELSNEKERKILENIDAKAALYVNCGMFFFDGKMYVCLGNSNTFEDMKFDIYEIDLSSKKKNKIVNVAMGNATVVGSNLYYMPYNNNGGNRTLYRLNVTMPAYIEKVAVMPEEFSMLHNNFVSNGNNMYFQSSGARKIWQVYPNGAAKVLVEFNDENEYSSVNSQGIIAYKLSNINRLLPWEIDVLDANGKTTNYSDFLGEAYFIKGKADFDKIEGTLSTTFNEKNLDGVIAKPTQKYFNTDGDMVVELEVTNTTGDAIRISSFSFLTVCDDKKHSVQLNGGGEIGSGASAVYTFVMPKEIIGKNAHQKKTGFNFAFSIGRKN